MKDNKIDVTTNMIRCQILIKSTMRYHHVEIRSIIGTFHLKITAFLDRETLKCRLRERALSWCLVAGREASRLPLPVFGLPYPLKKG
jgi:hypothetical protein